MELLKKLRLNVEKPLYLIGAPDQCDDYFADFTLKHKTGKEKPVDQLMLFVRSSDELMSGLVKLADYIGHDTLVWICYPKKSGSIASDLIHMKSWDAIFQLGYRGQTSAYIDEDWSALRVTNAPPKKPSTYNIPPEERKIEGVDFVKRTVKLPADAQKAVDKFKGMSDFFYGMSFTNKKEIVEAIVGAKKEETRLRRIEKMVEELKQKMHAKAAKGN